jgi:hypothetical protein
MLGLSMIGVPHLKHKDSFLRLSNSFFFHFSHDLSYISSFFFMSSEIILFQILYKFLKYLLFSLMKVRIIKFIQCGPCFIQMAENSQKFDSKKLFTLQ